MAMNKFGSPEKACAICKGKDTGDEEEKEEEEEETDAAG